MSVGGHERPKGDVRVESEAGPLSQWLLGPDRGHRPALPAGLVSTDKGHWPSLQDQTVLCLFCSHAICITISAQWNV
jgi:hypothetical protein